MSKVSVEYLRERFLLDRKTGDLFWKSYPGHPKKWNTKWAGKKAGSLSKEVGYIDVGIDYVTYRAHVIVWALVHGYWPEHEIAHRNGVRNDNRPCNLCEATKAQQRQNAAKRFDNTSGYTGVTLDKRRQVWVAKIHMNGKRYHVGQYATAEDAYKGYCEAKAKLHTFQPKVRKNQGDHS